jgi:hypothetical protein
MKMSNGVRPTLMNQVSIGLPNLWTKESIISPSLGCINVELRRHDIKIAEECDRYVVREQFVCIAQQPVKPAKLVFELGSRDRIPVGEIETSDQYPVDRRLDVSAMAVIRISRQSPAGEDWRSAPCEDSDTIPTLLTVPNRRVAGLLQFALRKTIS